MAEAERRGRRDHKDRIERVKEDVLRCYRDKLPIHPGLGFGEADAAVNELAKPATVVKSGKPSAAHANKGDVTAAALALLYQHPDWTNKQIAEAVGCHHKTLSNNKQFKAARAAARSAKRGSVRRGHKTAQGNLEAYDER